MGKTGEGKVQRGGKNFGNLKERQFIGNEFGKKKRCENDKQQIALDSGEEVGGWEAGG